MTLLEAAAHFAAVDAQRPPTLPPSYAFHPGDSVEEQLCRNVIQHVRCLSRSDPRRDAVVKRLEEELQGHLARGPLRLPDLPPRSLPRRPIAM